MDAVDDIFSTPTLSLWESPHAAPAFALPSSSPQNPHNFLRHSDSSFQHPLTDPHDLSPDLSPPLASSFALPNSLPYSMPSNLSHLQNLSTVLSQSLPPDNHLSFPFDLNSFPAPPDPHQPQHPTSLDPVPHHQHVHHQHQHQHHPPPTNTVRTNQAPKPNNTPTTRPRQSNRNPPSHQFLSNSSPPHQHHIPTSQSNSNLLSDHNSSAPISRLSSISIPTPTIATATTTAASPSTTNATHRSPPHTPPSANRPKSTATSNPKPSHVEPRSSTPNTTTNTHIKPKQTQPIPSNLHRTSHTSAANQNPTTLPTPTSPSASTHHNNTLQHSTTVLHATHRISKPRDKHARLRKRLKCCSQDQLVDHIIHLVRSSAIPEKIVTDNLPNVDIHRFVLKCQELRDSILAQLPHQPTNPSAPFDATAFRKCKKSLAVFRTSVVNMAKNLVEASLWTDVIHYCIAANAVNAETPVWSETAHNRTKRSVRTKLEQFALKAATALSKPKEAAAFNPDDHARAMQACQGVFPDVVAKLKRHTPSAPTESLTRSQHFDDRMISTSHLDIDI